jgi:dolichol-phosphate mannosyltransferase
VAALRVYEVSELRERAHVPAFRPLGMGHVSDRRQEQVKSLDIVIPAHNEEQRIHRMLSTYRMVFTDPSIRFIVAMDGCGDETASVVEAHAAEDARVQPRVYPKLGKGGVLMEAFRCCDADWVAFVDADGATPPRELARLVTAAMGADGAIASRRHPASFTPSPRGRGRRLTSWAFVTAIHLLFRLPYSDTQCGAKVLRGAALKQVLPFLSSRDLLIDVDLLAVAGRLGLRIEEVPTIWLDQAGSKVSTHRDSIRMFLSALRLWLHLHVLPVPAPASAPVEPATATTQPQPLVSVGS